MKQDTVAGKLVLNSCIYTVYDYKQTSKVYRF